MSLVTTLPHAPPPRERATALVFEDRKSRELLEHIERLAPSEATVLVTGETGTGKELVARHLHQKSQRAKAPFVAVNCGALSESLVDAELFGHEKGAFTGASAARAGWFEAANGGTLFLDEIGDLPLPVQVKLLRVLQEREVVRLGARTPIPIDVRLVAATNINLANAVAAGHFREDLFYRLHVAQVKLLPLRERPGDIMPLARFFAEQYRRKLRYPPVSISPQAEGALLDHHWPGNIRELENALHYAVLVCRQQRIMPADLQMAPVPLPLTAPAPSAPMSLEQALTGLLEHGQPDLYTHVEDTLLQTAYTFCHRNQLQTARLLGISRNVLRARLARLGLVRDTRLALRAAHKARNVASGSEE